MEKIKIREMKKTDIKQVKSLVRFLMVSENADNVEKNVRNIISNRIQPSLKSKNSKTFIAETTNKEIIGFLLIELRYKVKAVIAFLAVKPKYQKLKIGSSLMREAEKYAKNKKINILETVISKENKISQKFHKNNDFELFGYTLRKKI